MSTFVLVHGAFHGGWCWHKIVARLEARGHTVFAPDMPGHGTDRTPIADVTMPDIVAKMAAVIDAARVLGRAVATVLTAPSEEPEGAPPTGR